MGNGVFNQNERRVGGGDGKYPPTHSHTNIIYTLINCHHGQTAGEQFPNLPNSYLIEGRKRRNNSLEFHNTINIVTESDSVSLQQHLPNEHVFQSPLCGIGMRGAESEGGWRRRSKSTVFIKFRHFSIGR